MALRHATLHQMKIFTTLARHLNMTRAAETLHMTPAALSIQIKQLSEAVGAPLHEQIGKRLFLTATGRLVDAACRDVFERLEKLSIEMAGDQGLDRGSLKLSIITTAKYFAPRLLGAFCKQHPGIEISLDVDNRNHILERLKQNLDDLYIMGQVPENLNVIAQPFMENPLVVLAPADHPLTRERDIDPARLADEPFIAREPGSGTRLAAERFFEKQGVRLKVRMTLGSNEAVKQTVAGGLGLAVLSQHTLALDVASGAFAVLDVRGFPLLRQWYAVYPMGKQLSAVTEAFLEYIATEGASSKEDIPTSEPKSKL
ncbi:LysR family transcriptional regulator [Acidithiobacillus sp.]|jgi:DNA-binding transcriptional LysR family regulator|uniref:LysR family transcriptional regulator n=1 Tax=Acidithiobacillus sp. TaxID=1872118 RepID=UPI0025B9813E|nr:LysR family transcriptional regulator [Acidithiobacillus sp.]MCK9188825.1 LysR substrate-binding domain-containing protein [Acidithiobacillus sp.]MCK9358390.1 LysR substrate-binding domain-containing protein [Acidithiobacillus sp.]